MYTFAESLPLVKYMPLQEASELVNLMDSLGDIPQPKKKEDSTKEPEEYLPHWKPEINLNLVYDTNRYPLGQQAIPPELQKYMKIHWA